MEDEKQQVLNKIVRLKKKVEDVVRNLPNCALFLATESE